MEQYSDLDKMRYFRSELGFEFNLLAMRSTILVTCQSFLVVPFGILQAAPDFRPLLVPVFLIAALGIFVAVILREPINAAHRVIEQWLMKHRTLVKNNPALRDFAIDRDLIPGTDRDTSLDTDHVRSMAFSRYTPWAFVAFWTAALAFSVVRTAAGF
jgi:hypothetical protein